MMSVLSDNEFRALHGEPGTAVAISMTGTSAATAAALAAGQVYMLTSPSPLHLVLGATPTATTSDTYIPANVPFYFVPRTAVKAAVIKFAGADDATVTITPLNGYLV
jgi:hypothetical protein